MMGVEELLTMFAAAEPVVVPTRLFQMRQFFSVGVEELFVRPPAEERLRVEFPEIVQLVSVGDEPLL